MAYNGWTNYETWNVALWIGNDEGLYHAYREQIEQKTRFQPDEKITGEDVKMFYVEFMDATTPDLTQMRKAGEHIDAVNYDEIAEHWEEERQEMLAEA